MSEESKVTQADIMEQLQAGHRARVDGSILQNAETQEKLKDEESTAKSSDSGD